jgi:hypothetical protein
LVDSWLAGVIAWLEKKTGPAVTTLAESDLPAFLEANSPVVVGRFSAPQTAG